MKTVLIRVTGLIVGVGLVFPYEHDVDPNEKPLYRVPLYLVQVDGAYFFSAIRFGFRGHFERPWDPHRKCDEGINAQSEVVAKWNGAYTPHSVGEGNGVPGGFLIRQDMVYIHQGATAEGAGGTLSCIEIVSNHDGDDWNRFMAAVARQAGVSYAGAAVMKKMVRVTVEAAPSPDGLLVGRAYRASKDDPFQPDMLKDWRTATQPWSGK